MLKKAMSIIIAIVILICSLSAFSLSANAATSYANQLRNKGFSDSYVTKLVELHKKYPNWRFEPFKTNLNWVDAVAGERSYHSKQIVQKSSSFNSGYYCNCESCIKYANSYERPASATAVKYYMDPRNWLDEKYIFQFESNEYNSNQTIAGIESIISTTWMSNAYITYKDSKGVTQTYLNSKGNKVKYSSAIMQAARNSKLSAYYLASKIVQEVGGARNTAGGVCGTYSGYEGIYNYYNIGAYTGARDGLKWASNGDYKTNTTSNLRAKPTTSSSVVVKVNSGTILQYESSTAKQADGYVWYKVKVKVNSKTYEGYIRSDLVTIPTYNRPWTNPYLSIYNGAQYIANNFKYQFTGYLQKFNVNSASGSLYSHEYMTTVHAAANESYITYRAYSNANVLKDEKVFYIPVYKNMTKSACPAPTPSDNDNQTSQPAPEPVSTAVTGLKITGRTIDTLSYSWNKVDGATQYYVHITNNTRGTVFSKTVETNSATLKNLSTANQYTVKVKAYKKSWGDYSTSLTNKTRPDKGTGLKVVATFPTKVDLSWSKIYNADGYIIYKQNSDGKFKRYKVVKGGNTTSTRVKGLAGGNKYRFKVAAYVDNEKAGKWSGYVTARTNPRQVTGVKLYPTASTIKVNWSKVEGSADGYLVSFARDESFKDEIATRTVVGQSSLTYTGKNLTKGRSYYVRVRSYKTIDKKIYYGKWSSVKKATCQ